MYRYSNSRFRNISKVRVCMISGEHDPQLLPDPEYFPYLTTHPEVSKILTLMLQKISDGGLGINIFSQTSTNHEWFKLVTDIIYSTHESEVPIKCNELGIPISFYARFIRRLVLLNRTLFVRYVEYHISQSNVEEVCTYLDLGYESHHKDYLIEIITKQRILLQTELIYSVPHWAISLEGLHGHNLDIVCKHIIYYSTYCPKYHPKLLEYTQYMGIHQIFCIYRTPPKVSDEYLSSIPKLIRRWYLLNDIEPDTIEAFVVYCYIVFSKSNLFTKFNLHNTFANLCNQYKHKFNIDEDIRTLIMHSINRL